MVGEIEVELWKFLLFKPIRYRLVGNYFYLYQRNTLRKHTQLSCRAIGEIYDTSTGIRPPVYNPDINLFAIGKVENPQYGTEGIRAVCASQAVVMKSFTTCRAASRSFLRIVRGLPFLHFMYAILCYSMTCYRKHGTHYYIYIWFYAHIIMGELTTYQTIP